MKISNYIDSHSCQIHLDHEIFRPFYEIICQKDEFFNHIINLLRPNLEIMFQKTNFQKKLGEFYHNITITILPPVALEQQNSANICLHQLYDQLSSANTCVSSAIRSRASSIPTESRSVQSVIPFFSLISCGTSACVCVVG